MKKIDLGQTIGILANVGVIAGIIFLGIELRQNNELLEVQAEMSVSEIQTSTLLALIEEPELIELMLKDQQSLTEVERLRLLAMGLRGLRIFQGRHRLMERGLLDPVEEVQNMRSIFGRETLNYGLPQAWEIYKGGFPPNFVTFFEESVASR